MPTPALDYSKVFRQLGHMIVLSRHGKTAAAIDHLVMAVFALDVAFVPTTVQEVCDAVFSRFGLTLAPNLVQSSLDRKVSRGSLIRNPVTQQYFIAPQDKAVIESRVAEAAQLECVVRNEWLASLADDIQVIPLEKRECLWTCLRTYMARVFRRHGVETIQLLAPTAPSGAEYAKSLQTYLTESVKETCEESYADIVKIAVQRFFETSTPQRTRYLTQLLDGTFTFFALSVDKATSQYLRQNLSPIALFLDTNFIFGILKLHMSEFVEVSEDVIEIIRSNNLPFTLYYHEATLEEIERTISSAKTRLSSQGSWSVAMSKAAVANGNFSGIDLHYHRTNAQSPISVRDFLAKYDHIPELLAEYGFKPYPNIRIDEERKYRLIAEYDEFIKRARPERPKKYPVLDHDITVWLGVETLRSKGSSLLNAGALLLTNDYYFRRFEWQALRPRREVGSVVLPSQLLQVLRPFVPTTDDFDRRFVESFAIPEFRTAGLDSPSLTSTILGILNNYVGVGEETATRILANEMLLERLKDVQDDPAEVRALVEHALHQELLEEKEAALNQKEAETSATLGAVRAEAEATIREKEAERSEALARARRSEEEVRQRESDLREVMGRLAAIEATAAQVNQRANAMQAALDESQQQLQQVQSESQGNRQRLRYLGTFALISFIAVGLGVAADRLGASAVVPRLQDRRWIYGAVALVVGVSAILTLPTVLSWAWVTKHHNRYGIYGCVIACWAGIVWAAFDQGHRPIALLVVLVPALYVLFQIMGDR